MNVPAASASGLRPLPTRGSDGLYFSQRQRPGLRFSERMTGPVCPVAEQHGRDCEQRRCRVELLFTVVIDDISRFVTEPAHQAGLLGTASLVVTASLGDEAFVVKDGVFQLFVVDPTRVERREMRYRATLVSTSGAEVELCGFKDIYNHPKVADAWSDTTTLHVTLARAVPDETFPRTGKVVVSPSDFVRQLATFRVSDAASMGERVDTVVEFLRFFTGVVFDTYGRMLARGRLVTPDAPPTAPPVVRDPQYMRPTPTCVPVTTDDGSEIRLTRYCTSPATEDLKGPVLLSPGFGMTSDAFVMKTRTWTLVDHLCRANYDVWLLDYRASPKLEAAAGEFTIDDIARYDYPAAVDTVLARRKAEGAEVKDLLVVAHCIGSMALLMSILAGALAGKVRFAVCSQLGLHPVTTSVNELKAGFFVASLLRLFRFRTLDAAFRERSWWDWLIDKALRLYPSRQRCNNPVCRRVTFLFGESYLHERLDVPTHEAIPALFGVTSLRALQHLAVILRRGHVVDRHGEDVYLSNPENLREVPLALLHGDANRMFKPESTLATLRWLKGNVKRDDYSREVVPGFGHLDCFLGDDAETKVFPWILEQLDRHPARQRGSIRTGGSMST